MQLLHDPKILAKRLRVALKAQNVDLSHSAALEVVAAQLGFADWNTASALMKPTHLQIPKNWILSGANPKDYDVGVDPNHVEQGATIRARDAAPKQGGFATLMQSIDASPHLGKRLRLQADLRCEGVVGAATLWLRMDGAQDGGIRFDNMERRNVDGPLQGTQDWQTRHIVLDVPEETRSIHYGFYLRGSGQCWSRDFKLDQVDEDVAVTSGAGKYLQSPSNLGFQAVG